MSCCITEPFNLLLSIATVNDKHFVSDVYLYIVKGQNIENKLRETSIITHVNLHFEKSLILMIIINSMKLAQLAGTLATVSILGATTAVRLGAPLLLGALLGLVPGGINEIPSWLRVSSRVSLCRISISFRFKRRPKPLRPLIEPG